MKMHPATCEKKPPVPRLIMIFRNNIQVLEITTAADSKITNDVKQGKQRSQNNRAWNNVSVKIKKCYRFCTQVRSQ